MTYYEELKKELRVFFSKTGELYAGIETPPSLITWRASEFCVKYDGTHIWTASPVRSAKMQFIDVPHTIAWVRVMWDNYMKKPKILNVKKGTSALQGSIGDVAVYRPKEVWERVSNRYLPGVIFTKTGLSVYAAFTRSNTTVCITANGHTCVTVRGSSRYHYPADYATNTIVDVFMTHVEEQARAQPGTGAMVAPTYTDRYNYRVKPERKYGNPFGNETSNKNPPLIVQEVCDE